MQPLDINYVAVNRAFSSQSAHFDTDETSNVVLADWRQRIYRHLNEFLRPASSILELNAGTGIDAVHLAAAGHQVLATDLSDGMIRQLELKARVTPRLNFRQLSFEKLEMLAGQKFDFVFSNFGGLNCIAELAHMAGSLPALLAPKACVTFVIMPKVAPWEWLWMFKGKWSDAFRRFSRNGAEATIDGLRFRAYYHAPSEVQRALGPSFKLLRLESLGIFSPPPSAVNFVNRFTRIHAALRRIDSWVQRRAPFNRWGDHIILTFQYVA